MPLELVPHAVREINLLHWTAGKLLDPLDQFVDVALYQHSETLTVNINELPSQYWQKTSQFGDIKGNTKISLGECGDRIIERAKPSIKEKYIADGEGLFLRVVPNGTKTFCFRYTFGEKRLRRLLSLGPVPLLSLEDARERATDARKLASGSESGASLPKWLSPTVTMLSTCRQRPLKSSRSPTSIPRGGAMSSRA